MAAPFNTTSDRFRAFCDTNNEIPAPSSFDPRPDRIPHDVDTISSWTNDSHTAAGDLKLQCCCGRSKCIYLEHNNTLLGGIERDLETAARLGQALLTRHESYVTESQLEHERLTAYINELEKERTTLQTTNKRIAGENHELRTQLDVANTSLKESDNHVKSLEALLRDSESEIRRLNGLTRRAEELELKLLEMEKDRSTLLQRADDSEKETRNTIRRWKESELRVRQLESDIQKIEWEARQEKDRYEELVARLERERVLERELGGAEGRLKGAAALQGLKGGVSRTNVVSHFVRDILHDNATLQAGIAELRELLQASNDEVQNLRAQILEHQPVEFDHSQEEGYRSRPLSEQLDRSEASPRQVQQEVHVHHHYHAKVTGKKDRNPTIRKSIRRRAVMGPGMLPATPESSTPTTPLSQPQRVVSSPILPIALNHPQTRRTRWSLQSAATTSSLVSSFPSSPQSYFEQSSSIFDRLEAGEESSRPTSPESAAGFSEPTFLMSCPEVENEGALTDQHDEEEMDRYDHPGDLDLQDPPLEEEPRSVPDELETMESDPHDLTPKPSQILVPDPEPPDRALPVAMTDHSGNTPRVASLPLAETDPAHNSKHRTQTDSTSTPSSIYAFDDMPEMAIQPRLRRAGSHDSLVSISGMDIHLAKRPTTSRSHSASLLKGNKAYFAMSPSATRTFSAAPLTTVTEYTALSSTRFFGANASSTWTDQTAHRPQLADRNTSVSVEVLSGLARLPSPTSTSTTQQRQASPGGFGRLVGSWVRGKWGIAPMKSSEELRPSTPADPAFPSPSSPSIEAHPLSPFELPGGRTPGINQKGAIPGFRPIRNPTATGVQVTMVDAEGLKEILAEQDNR
ncbi:hypothetical protein A1O1_07222 [Capronia coronata CBS 617.96]|uniref:Uncharacterized protein n=1 Tax=Capronia coronata CBS 617.96 TaxID=1182541 RepID=W9YMV2_9EURO|nr:uncharacterized protein A1O1_07222 [Capronia coronata CBS 617.96]EXJ83599.1 hypothetical protein A1O1_07222 [Capronia coronata CBS 617.96]